MLLLSIGVRADAAPAPFGVNLDFEGPNPNFLQVDASASGTASTGLVSKLILGFTGTPNPQTDPIGLDPDTIMFLSQPAREPTNQSGFPETANLFGPGIADWTPVKITNVNLNLLNNTSSFPDSFALDPIVLETTFTIDSFGVLFSVSLDVSGALDLVFAYHLEDTAHVPEPGTIVLLGLGAVGLVPVVRRRFRRRFARPNTSE